MQSRRHAESFEGLNSSLAQSTEVWCWQGNWKLLVLGRNPGTIYSSTSQFTLDHNFSTRNPSRPSKVSKDSDCSLDSNRNLSEKLPSNGLGPGPGEVGQDGLKVLHLWCHSQKICNPQPKKNFFFVTNYKTSLVFWAFEQLSTTFGARVTLVQSHVRCGCFGSKCPKHTRRKRV